VKEDLETVDVTDMDWADALQLHSLHWLSIG